MKPRFDIANVEIANDGLITLNDNELIALERDFSDETMAGAANSNCTNPNCNNQTNEVCRNTLACGTNTNSTCTNDGRDCHDKDVSTDQ
jgi:hypothetical protein